MTLATCTLLAGTLGLTGFSTARAAATAQAAVTRPIKECLLSTRLKRLLVALIDLLSPAPLSEVLEMLAFCLALARSYSDAILQQAAGARAEADQEAEAMIGEVLAFARMPGRKQRGGVRVPSFRARWSEGSAHGHGPAAVAAPQADGPEVLAAAA